jgi:hypothetical protein
MSSGKPEKKAEMDANGPQVNQDGQNHSMGGRGDARGGGRQRDDMRGGMRQDVSKSNPLGDLWIVKFPAR